MTESDAYIALNLTSGLGSVSVKRLVEKTGSALAVASADDRVFRLCGIGSERAGKIRCDLRRVSPAKERDRASECGAVIITPADDGYPVTLRDIHDPPSALYVAGNPDALSAAGVALVGTRHPSVYGRDMSYRLGYQLAGAGWVVVSGLARGIDSAAHRGAVSAKGRSVGVLGSAIDRFYPAENRELAGQMIDGGGAVVSEFGMGRSADRSTFPMRNRIVSALSAGVVVVEAPLRSGAMITADQALEQDRCVMAVPGRADTPAARGGHRLIRDGAMLVETAEDIMEALASLPAFGRFPAPPLLTEEDDPEDYGAGLAEDEIILLKSLGREEMDVDLLIRDSGLPAGKVAALLIGLEIKKRVRMLPGRLVRAVAGKAF